MYLFTEYENTGYEEESGEVFCNQLEGYIFIPYAGKIKGVRDYKTNLDDYDDRYICVSNYETGGMTSIPCRMSVEHKKVYISEGNFNRYWKTICSNIAKENYRRGCSDQQLYSSFNELVDLTLMQTDTRIAFIESDYKIHFKGREQDIDKQRMKSKRVNAMEDSKIRFVYSKVDNVLHDKFCEVVKDIKDEDFCPCEDIPRGKRRCIACEKKLLIRSGIQSDMKYFNWYYGFFENGHVKLQRLRGFLGVSKAKLHMDSKDELKVKCKEDNWIIIAKPDGSYILKHNNYTILDDGQRYIHSEYHIQKNYPSTLTGIMRYIEGYNWRKHLKPKVEAVEEDIVEEQVIAEEVIDEIIVEEKIETEEKVSIWKRMWEFIRKRGKTHEL